MSKNTSSTNPQRKPLQSKSLRDALKATAATACMPTTVTRIHTAAFTVKQGMDTITRTTATAASSTGTKANQG